MGEEEAGREKGEGKGTGKRFKGRNAWTAVGGARLTSAKSLGPGETWRAATEYLVLKNINTYTVFLHNQGKVVDFL